MASNPTSHSTEALPSEATVANTRTPAPISKHEEALLVRILSGAHFEGAPELLAQVRGIQLMPAISDATHRIYVHHPDTPKAPYALGGRARIPGTVMVRHPEGGTIAQIDIWVEQGHLRAMHLKWAGARVPMTMPSPDWVTIEPVLAPTPAAIAPTVAPVPSRAPKARRSARGPLLAALAALCCLAVVAGAFALGRAGASDLGAARADGTAAGRQAGADDAATLGTFRGATEGQLAGYQSTYQTSFTKARNVATAKAAAAAQARADAQAAKDAAAASAFVPQDNTSCSGYRDARGYWICS